MDSIFGSIPYAFVYLDDILIASKSRTDHFIHLREVFSLLEENGLVVNGAKCELGVSELVFLGHQVTTQGILPLQERVDDLMAFPAPTRKDQLQRFLGILNYYN